MGWKAVKSRVLADLALGRFLHEVRRDIDVKNELATGDVTADFVRSLIIAARGQDYRATPHHAARDITVHVVTRNGWYVKFYFLDPDTMFISVHR